MKHLIRSEIFWYAVGFVVAIFVFGYLYVLFTPCPQITFVEGLYISVATISSLGYADVYPVGTSKLVASIQVIIGLALMGITIAKLTSQRLSAHVSRLYSSDARNRLQGVARNFEDLHFRFKHLLSRYGDIFQTPESGSKHGSRGNFFRLKSEFQREFQSSIRELKSRCRDFREDIPSETAQKNFFYEAPDSALLRASEEVDDAQHFLKLLIETMSSEHRGQFLDRTIRQDILDATDCLTEICDIITQHSGHEEIVNTFRRVKDSCNRMPERFTAITETIMPDQLSHNADNPYESS